MERKLSKIAAAFFVVLFCSQVFAQTNLNSPRLRIKLWSLLEPDPSLDVESHPEDEFYSHSIRELKTIAPYVFEGMIFGYDFVYTPFDNTRSVDEYFELKPSRSNYNDSKDFNENISYHNGYVKDNKLYCWAEFSLTHGLDNTIERKKSVVLQKMGGKGSGKVSDGEKGIEDAISEAVKNAVRNYGRTVSPNKPREINGTVLIYGEPSVSIRSGKYIVNLDFLLECDRIIYYQTF